MRIRTCATRAGAVVVALIITCAVVVFVMQASQSDEQPKVIAAVAPVYPPIATAVGASGTVLIEVEVNAAGAVTAARGVSGHPLLRRSAESSARHWVFTSAATTRTVCLTFVFRIVPKETAEDELTPIFTPPYQVEVRSRPAAPIVHSDPPSYVRSTRQRGKRKSQ